MHRLVSKLASPLIRQSRVAPKFPIASNASTRTAFIATRISSNHTISEMLPPMRFDYTPEELTTLTKETIAEAFRELDRIGVIPEAECSFATVIWPLAEVSRQLSTKLASATFLSSVSTDAKVRAVSADANKEYSDFYIEKGVREDIFRVVRAVGENQEEMTKLDGESRRLVEKMLTDFKHNGMYLEKAKRDQLTAIRKRLNELEVEYGQSLGEENSTILFSKEELEGCSEDFLESLSKDEVSGKYILTMKYPDYFGVLQYAKSEDVRRRMDVAFNTKCPENTPRLAEAVELRRQAAQLLGYAMHADFQLELSLAKESKAVIEFEKDLRAKLTPGAEKELTLLKSLKKADTGSDSFYSWDYHYYSKVILERDYALDDEKLKEYFSLPHVMAEMLKIYEQVLGLRFTLVTDAPKWHSDVSIYEVRNASDDCVIGHVYLDLHPREGKYAHAACFSLVPGCTLVYPVDPQHERRQYPACAMVANFTKPTATKPSLLKHDEVVTLFHELGHAMHGMCAKVNYSRFHGTNVERDFVEAPSQMLENWCWDREMLKKLARHYLRPEETLDEATVTQLIRAKNFNAGLLNLRQVFFGIYDMTIHTIKDDLKVAIPNNGDLNKLYTTLRADITLIPQPENSISASSWGHLMGGYDAGYYGYLWSQVFSADMFYGRFKKEGLLNPTVGMDYRRQILAPGGSRDGMDSVVAFLGRKPTADAFLHSIGIGIGNGIGDESNSEEFVVL